MFPKKKRKCKKNEKIVNIFFVFYSYFLGDLWGPLLLCLFLALLIIYLKNVYCLEFYV